MRGLRGFVQPFGGRLFIVSEAEEAVFSAVRPGARKGPRRCCIFGESVTFLFLGLLTREKGGQKRGENVTKKCSNGDVTLLVKNRQELRRRGSGFSS